MAAGLSKNWTLDDVITVATMMRENWADIVQHAEFVIDEAMQK